MSLCSKDIDYQIVSTFFWTPLYMSQNSSVGVATGYGLDGLGLISGKGKIFTPQRPDRLIDSGEVSLTTAALYPHKNVFSASGTHFC
jgi:hypothetical protein